MAPFSHEMWRRAQLRGNENIMALYMFESESLFSIQGRNDSVRRIDATPQLQDTSIHLASAELLSSLNTLDESASLLKSSLTTAMLRSWFGQALAFVNPMLKATRSLYPLPRLRQLVGQFKLQRRQSQTIESSTLSKTCPRSPTLPSECNVVRSKLDATASPNPWLLVLQTVD